MCCPRQGLHHVKVRVYKTMNTRDSRADGAPVNYLSYLLRLWRTGENHPWRVSLEDARTGERVGFSDLAALVQFLCERMQSPAHDEGDRA